MTDIETTGSDDPVILAGEYVLGVLEGEERATAHQRYLTDSAFAYAVEWWQYRLGQLSERADEAALSDRVWPAIEARLAAQRESLGQLPPMRKDRTGLSGWSLAGALAASAAAAAALALWLYNPAHSPVPNAPQQQTLPQTPQPQSAQPQSTQSRDVGPQLIVQARDESGRQLVSRVVPGQQHLFGRVEGLTPGNPNTQSPELWVVPANGQPQSLGLIPTDGEFSRNLDAREARLLTEGATLAVTIEDRAGAPHEAPTTPIILAAPLAKL